MAKTDTKQVSSSDTDRKQNLQKKQLQDLKKREYWMKWIIIGLAILVLLLILFLGYATDWTKGLHKDAATIDSSQDAAKLDTDGLGESSGNSGSGGTSGTSTTTNNSTTTTNTTTNNTPIPTPADPNDPGGTLLNLYTNTDAGDNINDLLDQSQLLGVPKNCRTDILIQICDFGEGDNVVTVKSLLGSGVITSITKNF